MEKQHISWIVPKLHDIKCFSRLMCSLSVKKDFTD